MCTRTECWRWRFQHATKTWTIPKISAYNSLNFFRLLTTYTMNIQLIQEKIMIIVIIFVIFTLADVTEKRNRFSICSRIQKLAFHWTQNKMQKQYKLTTRENYKTQNTYVTHVDAHGVNLKIMQISDRHAGIHALIPLSWSVSLEPTCNGVRETGHAFSMAENSILQVRRENVAVKVKSV